MMLPALHDRLQPSSQLHALEQARRCPSRPRKGTGFWPSSVNGVLLVLGADETRRRLRAGFPIKQRARSRDSSGSYALVTRLTIRMGGAFRPNARGVRCQSATRLCADVAVQKRISSGHAVSCGATLTSPQSNPGGSSSPQSFSGIESDSIGAGRAFRSLPNRRPFSFSARARPR